MTDRGKTFSFVDCIRIGQNKLGTVLESEELLSIGQVAAVCR